MNKKELYESIMKNVAKQVKKALNENVDDMEDIEDGVWGVEDFDNEADENGEIPVTLTRFCCGGRESIESYWNISVINTYDDYWDVKAVCTASEDRRYVKDDEVTFELYKDTSIWDIEQILQETLNQEGY